MHDSIGSKACVTDALTVVVIQCSPSDSIGQLRAKSRSAVSQCCDLQVQALGLTLTLCLEHTLPCGTEVGHIDAHPSLT